MVWGGRREGGSGWGTRVYLRRIHVDASASALPQLILLNVGDTVTVRAYAAAGGIAEPLYSVEVAEALVEETIENAE